MFLKMLPDLDMPLISLDTKNHYPKFNGLGDMAIVISETQIPFFGTPCINNTCLMDHTKTFVQTRNLSLDCIITWRDIQGVPKKNGISVLEITITISPKLLNLG